MPPRMIAIQETALDVSWDSVEMRYAIVHARASTRDSRWQKRLDDAITLLPIVSVRWLRGQFLITSPRSGNTYTVGVGSCTCAACVEHASPCWHRIIPRLVRRTWARQGPKWECPFCCGPMTDGYTPGGERAAECLVCAKAVYYQFVDTLESWPVATVATLPARISSARRKAVAA